MGQNGWRGEVCAQDPEVCPKCLEGAILENGTILGSPPPCSCRTTSVTL